MEKTTIKSVIKSFSGLFMLAFLLQAVPVQANDLESLNDEFNSPSTLSNWSRIVNTENYGQDRVESSDIGQTRSGWFTLVPEVSSWYEEYIAELMYKEVSGDFIVSTYVNASNRAGNGAPNASYSLAGLMIREPRSFNPSNRPQGGENHLFFSIGSGDNPGVFKTETKNTSNSNSNLQLANVNSGEIEIKMLRLGDRVTVIARQPGGNWYVVRRHHRPDFSNTVQVGLIAYTDWPGTSVVNAQTYNVSPATGNADLRAQYDYVRFERVNDMSGLNPATASDSELINAILENAVAEVSTPEPEPAPEPEPTPEPTPEPEPAPSPEPEVEEVEEMEEESSQESESNQSNQTETESESTSESSNVSSQPEAETTSTFVTSFRDIDNHWAKPFIEDLTEKGVFTNTTIFRPDAVLNRAELVKIIIETVYSAEEIDACLSQNIQPSWTYVHFPDVLVSDWFAKYVCMARANGIVQGYPDGSFRPSQEVNRAEALKIVFEALSQNVNVSQSLSFSDVPTGSWFRSYVAFAIQNNIVQGKTNSRFAPADNITRAEIAKIVSLSSDLK